MMSCTRAQEDPGAAGRVGVRAGRGRQAAGHADMQEAVERALADLERRIVEAAEQDYELPWTLL